MSFAAIPAAYKRTFPAPAEGAVQVKGQLLVVVFALVCPTQFVLITELLAPAVQEPALVLSLVFSAVISKPYRGPSLKVRVKL